MKLIDMHQWEVPFHVLNDHSRGGGSTDLISMDAPCDKLAIERDALQQIIDALWRRGYQVIGPTVRDGAIIYETVARLDDLPVGWTDRQDAGRYRIERRADEALFGYAVGPHSWKRFLHPPVELLWRAHREGDGFSVVENEEVPEPLAFIGVRACELRAIAIHDRVFLAGQYLDMTYKIRPTAPLPSRSIAVRQAAPAFASRWMPGLKSRRASTSL